MALTREKMASTPKISPRNEMAVPTHCPRFSSSLQRSQDGKFAASVVPQFRNSVQLSGRGNPADKADAQRDSFLGIEKSSEGSRAPPSERGFRCRQPNANSAFGRGIAVFVDNAGKCRLFQSAKFPPAQIPGGSSPRPTAFSINPSSDRSWAMSSNKLAAKSKSNLES